MGLANLYVQIGNNLIKGRIIQSVYFRNDIPKVVVTYLHGNKTEIDLEEERKANYDFMTEDEIDRIFNEICAIHAEPCYPSDSDDSGCPLGMANL